MTKLKNNPILLVFLIISLIYLPKITISEETFYYTNSSEEKDLKNWTLMLYFCADTREGEVSESLDNSGNYLHEGMLSAMNSLPTDINYYGEDYINVIILYDYPYTAEEEYGHAVIYEVKSAASGGVSAVAELGETNMGDEDTLSDFVNYCKINYPAINYALVLSDHGRGYAGFCFDYHAPHPYWAYALGDCLTVPELESALSGDNNVDVLIFDTCLGGSFEVAWQLVGEVSYMVGGQTTQSGLALHHPREIAYVLSWDVGISPLELAQVAFNAASDPSLLSEDYAFSSVSLYDLTKFNVVVGDSSFMDTFSDFTDILVDELIYNSSKINFFHELRNQMNTTGMHSSTSMLVDLYNFLETVLENATDYHYTETSNLASDLIAMLVPVVDGVLIDEWHPSEAQTHLHGFSLCLPDSYDIYQGFLYPNMYEVQKISIETMWDDFIERLFPSVDYNALQIPDLYRIILLPENPVIQLHVFFEEEPFEEFQHVGLNDDFINEPGMGIELGIQDAGFMDDLLFGNAIINIPAASLHQMELKADIDPTFEIVVNASTISNPSLVNMTVKHYVNNEVVWERNQLVTASPGQILSCEVSTNDTMTDLEPEKITTPQQTGFFGSKHVLFSIVFSISPIFMVIVILNKKNKK